MSVKPSTERVVELLQSIDERLSRIEAQADIGILIGLGHVKLLRTTSRTILQRYLANAPSDEVAEEPATIGESPEA